MDEMPATEYQTWRAFAMVEPIGRRRDDILTGIQCSLLANIHRGKDQKTFKPTDFVPDWWSEPVKQNAQQQFTLMTMLKALAEAPDEGSVMKPE
jgi:hypothetical protein